ncbi:hypothetical protein KSU1_C1077 [Candidatus Jettenia caeni]|uniref:Uncharacterized protein n=1 Tax=Candidatus Jettenia caeni TaxID=247490 RepID=I3ILS8_9BACT|nr:hypothetical protein [Candidatus Jettenia sp. AMX1]GAB62673.1 hypothetical protein KSU1_C1077 [Candidatus Jettenia caeni]GIL19499.1 MAG: hypothetical protein BroJett041_06130 [Candidatus Jettenia caeni]GJQ44835.1 MAG: hypothetical protein JETCAE04_05890 [Candidatus Jettenia caeni]
MRLSHETEPNLERINFISWYIRATPQDIELERKNNSAKLNALLAKYAHEVRLLSIIK